MIPHTTEKGKGLCKNLPDITHPQSRKLIADVLKGEIFLNDTRSFPMNTGKQPPLKPISASPVDAVSETENTPFSMPEFVASATECTGLSPSAVLSEQEADEYAQLYSVHRQRPSDVDDSASRPLPN